MERSTSRILTTHVGSLPRPDNLVALLAARDLGQPYDQSALNERIRTSVQEVAKRQAEWGLGIINDGEHSKTSFSAYVAGRLDGLEPSMEPFGHTGPTRDNRQFPGAYEEMK